MPGIMKIKTKISHLELLKQQTAQQLKEVCTYLNWTEEQYCEHQLAEYEAFLARMFYGWPEKMLNEVRFSPIMSGFWKNEWFQRNRSEFLALAKEDLTSTMSVNSDGKLECYEPNEFTYKQVYDEYIWIHSHRNLINQDYFMADYNRVLKLIRQQNKNN
ncbi:hypothetical protein HMPREF0765_4175 [Sphingobacterium spiritivorum ATCC 33300]|uniref:Uncharacterized protein n=2 Tax=Sphingobacterium spiritivorum TaxID=258 RepID=C2G3L9_SPHSI|nr:hypothetical protein HMPREF0765_4175 [Sphingobacterium spiritivorum ATCC 33300]